MKYCKACHTPIGQGSHGRLCRECRNTMRRVANGEKSRGISNSERDILTLTGYQKELLIGHLLGDGNLEKSGNRNPMFRLVYRSASQDYLNWLEDKLGLLTRTGVRLRKTGKYGLRAFLTTRRLLCLRSLFRDWYNPKKCLPVNLNLTPLIIATWFQDDGSYHRSGYFISSESFTKEENIRLARLLSDLLDAPINVSRCNSGTGYRLYIPVTGGAVNKFTRMILPYVHPIFSYKLHKSVETERSRNGDKPIQDTVQVNAS